VNANEFTPKQAKERLHEFLDKTLERIKDNESDELGYILQMGDIETIDRALNRLDELEAKATPKKPIREYPFDSIQADYYCRSCNNIVVSTDDYCPQCGQKLDWGK
jgi:rubrerythrin